MKSNELLDDYVKSMAPFLYLPNCGNLGDLLIAEGARQYFKRLQVEWSEYDEKNVPEHYNLVFAGGAKITNEWGPNSKELKILADKKIDTCLVLPHSINGPNDFLSALDERYVLVCREQTSLDYCKEHARGVRATPLCDDMAIALDLEQVERDCVDLSTLTMSDLTYWEDRTAFRILKEGFADDLRTRVYNSSVASEINGEVKRIAFLMRKDKEKAAMYQAEHTFDISAAWSTMGRKMKFNANILKAFSDALKVADVVVTDRLHVAIMAWHSGREVYMLDNSYKKLSGVYKKSLSTEKRVHLLSDGLFTPELDAAWVKLYGKYQSQQQMELLKNVDAALKKHEEEVMKVLSLPELRRQRCRYRLKAFFSRGKRREKYKELLRAVNTELNEAKKVMTKKSE